jgi:hypothetical protein
LIFNDEMFVLGLKEFVDPDSEVMDAFLFGATEGLHGRKRVLW